MNDSAANLAKMWIDCWNAGEPDKIPLAENFAHNSPFGRVEGREAYLAWVKPLAAENVADLTIKRVMGAGREAAIHFVMQTPSGPVECCDWVVVGGGEITEIHSFYDASGLDKTAGQSNPPAPRPGRTKP